MFYTGANWPKVWTRDTAMSVQYALAWGAAGAVGKQLAAEDPGATRGSGRKTRVQAALPNSTDRIIMAWQAGRSILPRAMRNSSRPFTM